MMRHAWTLIAVTILVAVAAGCGRKETSPRIVCDMEGGIFRTPFTYESFRALLQKEHGQVSGRENESLTTPHVEIRFRAREDGTILAERVVTVRTGEPMDPAFFFGLRDTEPPRAAPPPPPDAEPISIDLPAP